MRRYEDPEFNSVLGIAFVPFPLIIIKNRLNISWGITIATTGADGFIIIQLNGEK